MTMVYMAYSANPLARTALTMLMDWQRWPLGLLVSWSYLAIFASDRAVASIAPASTMLDSGAFSAWKSGRTIDREALTRETLNPYWRESVALDVIGDWRGSRENFLAMRAAGSPAMPVFHYREPFDLLDEYCALSPKVGLSCFLGEGDRESFRWMDECFRRAYPFRFHSFGASSREVLTRYPFHSADAVSWAIEAFQFGRCSALGIKRGKRLHAKPAERAQDARHLLPAIQGLADLQHELQGRWAKELQRMEPALT